MKAIVVTGGFGVVLKTQKKIHKKRTKRKKRKKEKKKTEDRNDKREKGVKQKKTKMFACQDLEKEKKRVGIYDVINVMS